MTSNVPMKNSANKANFSGNDVFYSYFGIFTFVEPILFVTEQLLLAFFWYRWINPYPGYLLRVPIEGVSESYKRKK